MMLDKLEDALVTIEEKTLRIDRVPGIPAGIIPLFIDSLRHLARTNPRVSWRSSGTTKLMLRLCGTIAALNRDPDKGRGLRKALSLPEREPKKPSPISKPYREMK